MNKYGRIIMVLLIGFGAVLFSYFCKTPITPANEYRDYLHYLAVRETFEQEHFQVSWDGNKARLENDNHVIILPANSPIAKNR